MHSVFGFVPDISAAKGGASEIITQLDSLPTIDAESTKGKVPQDVRGEIQFQDIHFQYPTRPSVKVLRGLNIVVRPGTYVALVGSSGCGKSTVIQLLEHFYDPIAGRILVSVYLGSIVLALSFMFDDRWTAFQSMSTTSRSTVSTSLWYHRNLRCMLGRSALTSYLVQQNPSKRSLKLSSKKHAEMRTSWNLSTPCLSMIMR